MTIEHHVTSPVRHRHNLAVDALPAGVSGTLLDIGGYHSRAPLILDGRPDLGYESLNVGPAWYGDQASDYTCASALLPFEDGRFDYVISVDTLEHVEPSQRRRFVSEAVRVASKRCVIVFPFRKDDETTNERHFLDVCERYGVRPMPSLVEHELFGLPRLSDALSFEAEHSGTLLPATPEREYWSWQMAMLLNSVAGVPNVAEVNQVLHEFQEQALAAGPYVRTTDEAYRFVLVVDK